MFSRHRRKLRLFYGIADSAITVLAFEAAYQTRLWLKLERVFYIVTPVKALLLGFAILAWLLLGRWLEIHDRLDSGKPWAIVRDTLRQCAVAAVSMVLFEYLLRIDLSRLFLAFFVSYNFILLCLFRLNAGPLVGRVRKGLAMPHYVLIVGLGERAEGMARELERYYDHGVRLAGFVSESGNGVAGPVRLDREYPVHPLSGLPDLLRRQVIDEILFAVDSRRLGELEEVFLLCDEEGVRTRVAVDFVPHVNSEVYLERLGSTPLLTFAPVPHDEIRLMVKRLSDIAISAVGLVALAPFMLLVAALVRLTSPGPAIFRQQRCGLNGRRFTVFKFRSMCQDAEQRKQSLNHLNRLEVVFKIPADPRLTPIGRFLRKFSIDEWPQLWNVLRGEMSLVGPRPAVPEEVEQYKRWQRRRLRMRPGLTCLWAVAGRSELDFETWMKMDMLYIDNWSLSLDWKILLQTIPRVLTGKGAH